MRHRFLLQPRWVAFHVLVLVAVPVCAALGLWQFQRYNEHSETTDKSAKAEAAASSEPTVALAQELDGRRTVTSDDRGRNVVVAGRYDGARQLVVPGREVDGRDGSYVLTPLQPTEDPEFHVLVVRGWLAGTPGSAAVPPAPAGEVRVTGRLEPSETEHGSGIDRISGLPPGQISIINTPELVNLLPYGLYDGYVALTAQDPADTASGLVPAPPVKTGKSGGISGRAWQNLGYTAQWFVFAGASVFLWWRVVRREIEERQEAEEAEALRELGLLT